ncbi:MAG: hypothetical protein V4592_16245 [Bacteroidota bacterium]
MKFHNRYINGEDGRLVYNDIYRLGQEAFDEKHYADVYSVLVETFNRVAFNLKIILSELKSIGYVLNDESGLNFQKPLLAPLPNTDHLLIKLDNAVSDFGYVPVSLKLFYSIVGSCNLGWNYDKNPNLFWRCADPIQISSLNDVVSEVSDTDWKEYLIEVLEDDISQDPCLELAADYFHKDNVSGGPPYSIQITKNKSIDSLFLNEAHNTTFIDYLRICMENCGFSRITDPQYKNDYQAFFEKVKPQLKSI